MTEKQLPCPSFLTTKTLENFFFLAIKFLGQMVDFCCCHSPELVVFLKEKKKKKASFWTQALKMGLLMHQIGMFGACRHASVCLLLNIA